MRFRNLIPSLLFFQNVFPRSTPSIIKLIVTTELNLVVLLHDASSIRTETKDLTFYAIFLNIDELNNLNLYNEPETSVYSDVIKRSTLFIFEIEVARWKECELYNRPTTSTITRGLAQQDIVMKIINCKSEMKKRVNLKDKFALINYDTIGHPTQLELIGFLEIDKNGNLRTNSYENVLYNDEDTSINFRIQVNIFGDIFMGILSTRTLMIESRNIIGITGNVTINMIENETMATFFS